MKKEKKKTIYRVQKNENYVCLNNEFLRNQNLSWKAKGILAYFLSLKDNWIIHLPEISKHSSNGITSLYSGIKELRKQGYVSKKVCRSKKTGRITKTMYIIYERPENLNVENPDLGFPHKGSLNKGNQPILNIDIKVNNEKSINMPAGQAGRANFENSSIFKEEKEKKKSIKEEPTLASLSQRTTLLGTKQKEMTFHQRCAKKLIETVHEVFHSNNSTSFANWAKEFEKLERINQIEPERIDKVLSYFCEELKEKKKQGKGSVLSYSAGQFRKNFIMIEQFMEQKEDRTPKKIELDKEGKMTLHGLSHLEWPKGAAARLPEAIQKSQKGLTQFIELNKALASKAPNGIAGLPFTTEVRVAGFAKVVKGKMVSRIAKLKAYYEIIHERIKNWKNWNGRFDPYILNYKNPVFQDTYLKVLAAERWGKDTEFLFGEYIKTLEELEAKADNNEKQA